jgi:hypothetical protein
LAGGHGVAEATEIVRGPPGQHLVKRHRPGGTAQA